jgi:hypothetical protein
MQASTNKFNAATLPSARPFLTRIQAQAEHLYLVRWQVSLTGSAEARMASGV